MFVLELSKSSGICLAALSARERLVGYLICSRYDTVWHIMNIAVDPDRRREGIASALLAGLYERVDDRAARASRSRCAAPTTSRSTSTNAKASAPPACAAATTRTTARTRSIMWRTPATLLGSLRGRAQPGPVDA